MAIIYLYIVALPRIMQQPSSTMTEVYNVATFECTARSYGIVSITWKRLNSELPETANITMSKTLNDITSVLRIEKIIGYYKGYYYCVIENKAGKINSRMAYCNVTGILMYNFKELCISLFYLLMFYSALSTNDHTTKTCCCTS